VRALGAVRHPPSPRHPLPRGFIARLAQRPIRFTSRPPLDVTDRANSRRRISPAEPLLCPVPALTIDAGKGNVGKNSKNLFVVLLSEPL
jgi:hypothetical protein